MQFLIICSNSVYLQNIFILSSLIGLISSSSLEPCFTQELGSGLIFAPHTVDQALLKLVKLLFQLIFFYFFINLGQLDIVLCHEFWR